jgi:MbtH protein
MPTISERVARLTDEEYDRAVRATTKLAEKLADRTGTPVARVTEIHATSEESMSTEPQGSSSLRGLAVDPGARPSPIEHPVDTPNFVSLTEAGAAGTIDTEIHPSAPPDSGLAPTRRQPAGSTDPFDDEEGRFYVLVNDEEQHSLWPTFAEVPAGWRVVFGEDSRKACVEYVEQNLAKMQGKSLRDALGGSEESSGASGRGTLFGRPTKGRSHD